MGDGQMDVKEYDLISRINEDVSELKKSDKSKDERLHKLEINDRLQDRDIQTFRETMKNIEDNTIWLRRAFIKATITIGSGLILAALTALVAYYFTH